ncbi:hypothetical protein AVEN_138674-1 [Araneus ventricosus]|uniref:Uncharacterized protein n=1 Tax=Araneus ventricosus TaxID=182803 RepID=A0A4Y2X060_ARAVE|nr:hypothetical protein AVEN_138674-1 [Araneus ventricosus]
MLNLLRYVRNGPWPVTRDEHYFWPLPWSRSHLDFRQNVTNLPEMPAGQTPHAVTFIQNGESPHNAVPVQHLRSLTFGADRVISRSFPYAWPPRSCDPTPYDFWLWRF